MERKQIPRLQRGVAASGKTRDKTGDVDWPAVMQAFEDIGYDGWATGEMIPAYGHASDQIIYNTAASMGRILEKKF